MYSDVAGEEKLVLGEEGLVSEEMKPSKVPGDDEKFVSEDANPSKVPLVRGEVAGVNCIKNPNYLSKMRG